MSAETLGQKIRRLRREHGLSETMLAAMLSVTQQTVSAYEYDKAIPTMKRLVQRSAILHVSPAFFYPSVLTKTPQRAEEPVSA